MKKFKTYVVGLVLLIFGQYAHALNFGCRVFDSSGNYEGQILFEYNEKNQSLKILKTQGENQILINHRTAWINEAVGKSVKNISKERDLKIFVFPGQYEWKFGINFSKNYMVMQTDRTNMAWQGRCKSY